MKAMLKWQLLTQKRARSCRTTCLNILGLGKGGLPEEHGFERLGNPDDTNLDVDYDIPWFN